MNFEERISLDATVFGTTVIRNCVLKTFPQRCWGAWKVLTGEAGILLLRVDPTKVVARVDGGRVDEVAE